jgi:hypothetical protein
MIFVYCAEIIHNKFSDILQLSKTLSIFNFMK